MNYRNKIKALIEQVSGTGWQFHQACKPQNRKVFPFYCRASLCSYKYVNGVPVVRDRVKYDDNPEDASNETCYWGWVVFEDVRTVKFYEGFPKKFYPKLYTYSEQIHGWTEPINFDKKFESSVKHRAVWYIALTSSVIRYYLNDYKNTGITTKIYSDHIKEALHGGTSWGTDSDKGWFEYSGSRGIELSKGPFVDPFLKLSHPEIISIINDILYENSERKQLTLF